MSAQGKQTGGKLTTQFQPFEARGAPPAARYGVPLTDRIAPDAYTLTKKLREGGMATVYEATHPLLGKAAIKILLADLLHLQGILDYFNREIELTASLSGHPGIVKIMATGKTMTGLPFYVMELLEGQDVGQKLAGGQLPVPEAIKIVAEVCGILQVVHNTGIIHRDIKPENIFLAQNAAGNTIVKLLDFGIAKRLTEPVRMPTPPPILRARKSTGTPQYMAPEQFENEYYDQRADLYALGMMVYTMLSNKYPFEHPQITDPNDGRATWEAYKKMHQSQQPIPLRSVRPDVPKEVEAVVMRLLAKNPDDRYQSANDVKEALIAYLPQEPRAKEEPQARPKRMGPIRRVTAFATVALAAAVLVGLSSRESVSGESISAAQETPTVPMVAAATPASSAVGNPLSEPLLAQRQETAPITFRSNKRSRVRVWVDGKDFGMTSRDNNFSLATEILDSGRPVEIELKKFSSRRGSKTKKLEITPGRDQIIDVDS